MSSHCVNLEAGYTVCNTAVSSFFMTMLYGLAVTLKEVMLRA